MGIHIHIHHEDDRETKQKLNLIIQKLNIMGENLSQIKADLQAANAKVDKVQADVTRLHDLVDNVDGETPTAEEWAEVKQMTSELNNKLQNIDDQTPEETPPPAE